MSYLGPRALGSYLRGISVRKRRQIRRAQEWRARCGGDYQGHRVVPSRRASLGRTAQRQKICPLRTDVCIATEARLREATTLTAGALTSVRSGAGLTLVSVGALTATSLTPIASRPCLVMRSAMGPASASRRQARSEPYARTSSSSPVRMSLSTAFRTASPVTFAGRSTPRSLRREAEDRMTSWVSVSLDIGILHCVGAASFAATTTTAPPRRCSRRGRIPEGVSRARNCRTTALFAAECQSFLDNLIAGL